MEQQIKNPEKEGYDFRYSHNKEDEKVIPYKEESIEFDEWLLGWHISDDQIEYNSSL